ncbi:MAG: Glyoxalase/bleomycin resistance protein/dioxygenase [Candidatus Nomurabacteria bacterium]|jgi:predicted enzyme related to lactoylglutathione lyase|nr:Glyoxalase/bleomycin resistance protein/dioxygenase [Candidatus Nomurabacteria bacterium]
MNPVVHFEMGYVDRDRMKQFYEAAFGWKMQQMGAAMGNYVVVQTTDTDEKGMVKAPGTINGGFYQKTDNPLSHAPSVVIAVPDIKQAMQAVTDNGGTILGGMGANGEHTMEPGMIPGVGLWISIQDTEGNRASLLQPLPRE